MQQLRSTGGTRALRRLPCTRALPAEVGFARWRKHPERITGFYARLLEGEVPNYKCTHVGGGPGVRAAGHALPVRTQPACAVLPAA